MKIAVLTDLQKVGLGKVLLFLGKSNFFPVQAPLGNERGGKGEERPVGSWQVHHALGTQKSDVPSILAEARGGA